jgi:hypothetical protein
MSERETADDGVKHPIYKWQMLGVSFTKFDGSMQSPGQLYHAWRQIDANTACTPVCRLRDESTRTRRDVQKIDTATQVHRVKDGSGGQGGNRRKKLVVGGCQSIVAFAFERTQSFTIDG